ncbi:MAG: cation:proton antiporter [Spirochaetales bacterium]|nr:cation:proton antiporter [Spirochaetales bacterium]
MFPLTDPILVFAILAAIILISPVLYRKFRIPDLVLLIAFGILIGPKGLNIIEQNTGVVLLGAVGKLYIMFLAGLEIDLYRFSRSYKRSIFFGLMTFLFPQILGTLMGYYLLGFNWTASLLLASMFASHTLLAYPITSRFGISRSEPVAITVGATIITDTLALLVLAIIADSSKETMMGAEFWLTIGIGLALLVLIIAKIVPVIARWFFRNFGEQGYAQFLFVLFMMCLFSYLSYFAKMEPIIGAFLVGAAFNRLIPENSPLMNRVQFAGNTLFIPFFLISVGMLVDPLAMLTDIKNWIVGGLMVAAVIITKYMAVTITRLIFKYDKNSARVMFGLSVVQAAATLAAVVVGYELKIFDSIVLNGAILMVLVTCPLGFTFVDRFGRKMTTDAPAPVERSNYEQRFVVEVSDPRSAIWLTDLAIMLRSSSRPGGIFPLSIALDQKDLDTTILEREKLLSDCLTHAIAADFTAKPELRISSNFADGIINAARELRASLVLSEWKPDKKASIRMFGSPMQHLAEYNPSRLMFVKVVRQLNTTKRVVVPLLPFAARRRDIHEFIKDVKHLSKSIGAEIMLHACGEDGNILFPAAQKAKPDTKLTTFNHNTWRELWHTILNGLNPDDFLIIPAYRRSCEMWSPAYDNLWEQASARYPQIDIAVCYHSLPEHEEIIYGKEQYEEDNSFPLLFSHEIKPGRSIESAIQSVTAEVFPARKKMAIKAAAILARAARTYPIELAPGIVLLHARFKDVNPTLLAVCHSEEGWQIRDFHVQTTILLVLLGPEDHPPEKHLKILSMIVSRIRDVLKNGSLTAVTSAKELTTILKNPAELT